MAAELRWILAGLSLVLLAGIWWWGARRSGQAPGNAVLRESKPTEAQRHEAAADIAPERDPVPDQGAEPGSLPRADEWVSPFEPLSIRTSDYDRVPILDGPMMVHADAAPSVNGPAPLSVGPRLGASPAASAAASGRVPTLLPEPDRSTVAAAQAPNSTEQQRIVTVRVCAAGEARWSGAALLSALETHGLAYGRYQVFHRRHVDGRSLFCVASLVEPGTFDVARMAAEEFRGVTLFAVLPGPIEPVLTIDELLEAARGLAQELSGMVQDAKGMPLSPQRAAALRDDVARFQASLSQV
jgi:cell division protein ZipA